MQHWRARLSALDHDASLAGERIPLLCEQGRGQHEAALDVLRTLSQAPDELPVPPTGARHAL